MSSDGPGSTDPLDTRKPRSELRHWSTYASVGAWFADYHGYVPIPMAVGLDRLMRERGLSFPDAYRLLLGQRRIIHIDPADDLDREPEPDGRGPSED